MISICKLFEDEVVLGNFKTAIGKAADKARADYNNEMDAASHGWKNFMEKSKYKGEVHHASPALDPVNYVGAAVGGMAAQGIKQGLKTAAKSVPSDAAYFAARGQVIGR